MDNEDKQIDKIYKPTSKEADVREYVYKRFYEMSEDPKRERAEKEWERGEKAWEAIRRTDLEEWQSNYYVPLTTSVVESIIAETSDRNSRPLILPRGPEDAPKIKVINHAYEYSWEVGDSDMIVDDIIRSGIIRGTGFAQEMYYRDKRIIKEIIELGKKNKSKGSNGRREFTTQDKEVYEYDDCYLDYVSNWDMFWDEKAEEFNRGTKKSRDAIRRYAMTYDDAKDFFSGDVWNHLGNFKYVRPGMGADFYKYYKPEKDTMSNKDMVEVLWYWSRRPEDSMVVMINDVVVRMGPNIFKHKWLPFAKAIDIKRLDSFVGKGEPALLDSIQEEVNTMRQMIHDRNHLDIDKMFVVSQNSMLDDEDLIARPHGAIPSDDPNAVKPIEYNDIPLSVERTLKAINEDSIRVTGIDDRFQSLQKAPSTATEAAILKESTLKRIKMKIKNLEKGLLVDVGRMRVANIMQFYSQPKLELISGDVNSTQIKQEMAKYINQDMLEIHGGKPYVKKYKEIRTKDVELFPDERGNIQERSSRGYHFFELKPEYFMPVASGGFDIRYNAGANLPVSKPLMQSKFMETFDRVMPFVAGGQTDYSLQKWLDKLVEIQEQDPEELKTDEVVSQDMVMQNRTDMAIELAGVENQKVINGEDIPPAGTPFAPPAHTMIHVEFMKSPPMKEADEQTFMKLLVHAQGEARAIEQRSNFGATAQPQNAGEASPSGSQPFPAANIAKPAGVTNNPAVPALVQGGAQVPTGAALGNG